MSEHIKSPERRRAWQLLHDALEQLGVFACLTNAEQVLVWVDGVGVLRLVAGVSGLLWRTTEWGKEPTHYSAWASPQQLVRAMLPSVAVEPHGQLAFNFGGEA
jgi:hypothetical protein